jgi:hypothetical protein
LKGNLPGALRSFLQNPHILKVGRNVGQDLKRLQKECQSSISFAGALDLANIAKSKGIISDARIGLADLCAIVLHTRLDKSSPLRVRTDWDSDELSFEQLKYAALDAWASLQIYQKISQILPSEKITQFTQPGTPVSILHDDGQVIAYGILSLNSTSPCRGINITSTRACVTVQHITVSAAILPLHGITLSSLGPPPFNVVVKQSKIQKRLLTEVSTESDMISPLLQTQPVESTNQFQELLQFMSIPVSADENWTEGVDDSIDTAEEMDNNANIAEIGESSVEGVLTQLQELETELSSWSPTIRSRVIMDVWHAMAHIKVSKEHGFRRPFARALRDAILVPDAADKTRISLYLASVDTSWEDVLRFNASWLWKHCKRIIPPPEQLYPLVKDVYAAFGSLLDAKTKQPLFNSRAWKDAGNVLKAIKAGFLSDPPGIPLYFQIGVDKRHGNLPIYRCARGTNNAEGGVHHSGRRHLPISGVSARHASTRLRDFVLMHNLVVGTLNRTGTVYKGHFDVWLINHLQLQLEATQYLIPETQKLTGWINGDLYISAGERIGILPVPDSIRVTADIESYHIEDKQFKHSYLAQQQETKYAVVAIHTSAEKSLFKKLLQEHPFFNQSDSVPDWKKASKIWNREANGQEIFYKVCFEVYYLVFSNY